MTLLRVKDIRCRKPACLTRGVVLKVLVKRGPLVIQFLQWGSKPNRESVLWSFGDKYFEQLPAEMLHLKDNLPKQRVQRLRIAMIMTVINSFYYTFEPKSDHYYSWA